MFETKAPSWVNEAREAYLTKLEGFMPFEVKVLKSPSADRDSKEVKLRQEADLLLRALDAKDLVVLFDESGTTFKQSEDFARALGRALESGKQRITFCIGGPYGFDASVKTRANASWSLSTLTMNHWVAQIMALEQVYRGLTIIKGQPYHNR